MEFILVVSSVLLWVAVLFNLLLTIAIIRRGSARQSGSDMANVPTLEIGSQAPDFTAQTLGGKTVTQADYAGKPVVFVFISPTCRPCVEKLPALHDIGQKARQVGIELILVNTADNAQIEAFVREHHITLSVLIAPRESNPFMEDYQAAGTPFFCVVDGQQKVQSTGFFDSKWNDFVEEWVDT